MTKETEAPVAPGWEMRGKPPSLFRRFEFSAYSETRSFLDALETLSKDHAYYPDLGFAAKYVNVTIQARDGQALATADYEFAVLAAALAAKS